VRLPQDIANLLAVAIRDVIWYKRNVCRFLEHCEVPRPIVLEAQRMSSGTPTVKIVLHVLDRLANGGDEGFEAARRMLTNMYHWNDLHSGPPDRKRQAASSLEAFRNGYESYRSQQDYLRESEKKMHAERVERT